MNVSHVKENLERYGKKTAEYRSSDGTVLLAMPYGGRMIGLCSARNERFFSVRIRRCDPTKIRQGFCDVEDKGRIE